MFDVMKTYIVQFLTDFAKFLTTEQMMFFIGLFFFGLVIKIVCSFRG